MAGLHMGLLQLESIVRAPLVVVADPVVAASGPPVTADDLAGRGAAIVDRPAGRLLAFANARAGSGLFVWVAGRAVAVVSDPDAEADLAALGDLTVGTGRLVVGEPAVVAAWGPDVDTGDGSPLRARMHRGRHRLGLIVVAHTPCGSAPVESGRDAVRVGFPDAAAEPLQLRLAG